jgi:hypothetical protein
LLWAGTATAQQYTLIPDANFETKLIALGLDTGSVNGKVVTSNISSVESIDLSYSSIQSLTGIQDFTALKKLNCKSNPIPSLALSSNKLLTELNCQANFLKSLDLSQNTALTYLDCSYNNGITALNVTKNLALKYLDCSINLLVNLDLSKNIALENFNCYHNSFASIDVSNNTALSIFELQLQCKQFHQSRCE